MKKRSKQTLIKNTETVKNSPKKFVSKKEVTFVDETPKKENTKSQICKDFYETGYCNRGDSCKYAHIRNVEAINDSTAKSSQRSIDATLPLSSPT